MWMRSSQGVKASDCQCRSRNSPGLDPSILRIWGAADEAVLNTVHRKKIQKMPLLILIDQFFGTVGTVPFFHGGTGTGTVFKLRTLAEPEPEQNGITNCHRHSCVFDFLHLTFFSFTVSINLIKLINFFLLKKLTVYLKRQYFSNICFENCAFCGLL